MSHFIYLFHPKHEAILVPYSEEQKYLSNGWYDSPTKFPDNTTSANGEEVKNVVKKPGRPPKNKVSMDETDFPLDAA